MRGSGVRFPLAAPYLSTVWVTVRVTNEAANFSPFSKPAMTNRRREGNRPDRRLAPAGFLDEATKQELLASVRYVGSSNHKLRPGDYGFVPSHNPRPSKSACDDLRAVLFEEASQLFRRGIECGMVSRFDAGGVPKYVWAVDEHGEVYESKTRPEREIEYHGYRLSDDERTMRDNVLREWRIRCP